MKKINMMIAAFAVLAAAPSVKAGDRIVNFDGKEGAAITAQTLALEGQDDLPVPGFYGPESLMPGSTPGNTCCGVPMGPYGVCMAVCTVATDFDIPKAVAPESFKGLARFYQAQEKIKKAAAAHFTARNEPALAAAFSAKEARVAAEPGNVYLVAGGKVAKIQDAALADTVMGIVKGDAQSRFIDPIDGTIIIVGCMYDDACWGAVGDGVSQISQWLHS